MAKRVCGSIAVGGFCVCGSIAVFMAPLLSGWKCNGNSYQYAIHIEQNIKCIYTTKVVYILKKFDAWQNPSLPCPLCNTQVHDLELHTCVHTYDSSGFVDKPYDRT